MDTHNTPLYTTPQLPNYDHVLSTHMFFAGDAPAPQTARILAPNDIAPVGPAHEPRRWSNSARNKSNET